MRNLIELFIKYGTTILFIFLEVICFLIIINFNRSQNEIFLHSANLFSGRINNSLSDASSYFKLQAINDSILVENARLLETIINFRITDKDNSFREFEANDSLISYNFIPARITNKTIHLRNNHITLAKGRLDSIETGMGVISENGIVGIIKEVTDHYSHALIVLNSQSRISASLKNSDFHGTLIWSGKDPNVLEMITLPKHAKVSMGDTIITSGYSTIFPYGIEVGQVEDYNLDSDGNNYQVSVRLFNDIANLSHVYIVKFPLREEKEIFETIE